MDRAMQKLHISHASTQMLNATVSMLLFFMLPFALHAQVSDVNSSEILGIGNPILLETVPTSPQPNSTVMVRAKSFALDLNRSTLSWQANGQVVAEGVGVTEVVVSLGDIGSVTTVRVSASGGGATYVNEIIVQPATVDLLWQAEAYTPSFYRGKALPSSEASTRVVAVPHIVINGQRVPVSELVFTWKAGSRVLGNFSGTGKNSIVVTAPRLVGRGEVSVTVETLDESIAAVGFVNIHSAHPQIVFYENDPVLGMRYEQALEESFDLQNEEITVTAHPFYFSGKSRTASNNEFSWSMNGEKIATPLADQSSIILRQTGGAGVATVSLSLQNLKEILQQARSKFQITFGGAIQVEF